MSSVSGWSEGIILSLAFLTVFGFIVANMNAMYGKNYNIGLSDNSTEQLFINYQETAQSQIEGGEVEFDSQQGVTLKSSYGLAKDVIRISWTFLSGGWIETLASYWNVGESGLALARALRILYFISLVFALLYALFKVVF